LKKNSWSGFTSRRGTASSPKTRRPPVSTIAGIRVRTSALTPRVTRGPSSALLWRGFTSRCDNSAGSEKKETTPAKPMPIAVNRPSWRIGETSVASSDRKPAAVLMVVRIIGIPTCDRAEDTRST
jgi:hypothetical protein